MYDLRRVLKEVVECMGVIDEGLGCGIPLLITLKTNNKFII